MANAVAASESIQTVRAEGWTHLMEELYRDNWDERIRRFRSPYVFRGVDMRGEDLEPGLSRLVRRSPEVRRVEGHLLRNFRKYASAEFPLQASNWYWLTFAQHHGLPTRLLDWSFSPLVALHFATEEAVHYRTDGVVWCINHKLSNQLLPEDMKAVAAHEGADIFTAEMLEEVAPSFKKLEKLSEEPFLVFMEPPSLDVRITNQFALFSIMSNPEVLLRDWLISHTELAKQIIIPAGLKLEIRDKLDQAGVNERMLYPGADGLARWLTRYYSTLDPAEKIIPSPQA